MAQSRTIKEVMEEIEHTKSWKRRADLYRYIKRLRREGKA